MRRTNLNNAIELIDVSKKYTTGFEIRDVSFNIKKGYVTGLIGRNGAGKTTLIKLILNILHEDKGDINIFGQNIKYGKHNIKEDIGIVVENMFFPEELKVKELNTIAKNMYKNWDTNLFFSYLKKFELPLNLKINKLSMGMKKKLQIIVALSYKPKLLIFDEATSSLDPVVRREIIDIFLDYMQDDENTILMSTHIVADLEDIADEIIMIEDGNVILHDYLDDIINDYGILKCSEDVISKLEVNTILAKTLAKYNWEVLVNNRNELKKKNPSYVIEKADIEKVMYLMSKGGIQC